MKEFFYDLWEMMIEPIDGWVEGIVRVVLWALIAVIVFLILWGIFYLLDSVGRPKMEGYGNISGFGHSAAYTSTTMMKSGDSYIPMTTYHPESWTAYINIEGDEGSIGISESYYKTGKEGDRVYVTYARGRISGSLYIKEFKP